MTTRPYAVLHSGDTNSLLTTLLHDRGLDTKEAQTAFLQPSYEMLHDPHLLSGVKEAVVRISSAMESKETIAIFSDYDCDGIPGAVVLHDFFTESGYTEFFNHIPHRHYDGFGLSKKAVDAMHTKGATLIITIDCGTSDSEAVDHARMLGIDVIVTDHHEPGQVLPDAVAVINPKLGTYPFPHLCGAGVVFKLAQALLATGNFTVPKGHEKWWLDMVGVATIADMVPLVGENRVLAQYGLLVLRKSRRPGVQQLLRKAKISQAYLTEEDIGFTIGPRINAASRMDAPEHAFHLLATRDESAAGTYADTLEKLNNERKGVVATMTREIHTRLKDMIEMPPVLVLGNPLWRPALVGLAANKLAEEHRRPVFLWGRDGNGVIKGSCRAGGGISVVRLMEATAHIFHEYGGHHASGGFAVHDDHIHRFQDHLTDAYTSLGAKAVVVEPLQVDAVLALDAVYGEVRNILKTLAPFGAGNKKPLFAFEAVMPLAVESFGKTKEHTKLLFKTTQGTIEAIAFFIAPDGFTVTPVAGATCTVIAHIEESFFIGKRSTRLRIIDIV